MAGLYNLNKDFKPKCPHCYQSIDLKEYWKVLFQTIIDRLDKGERVTLPGFGAFEAKPYGGWDIKGIDGQNRKVPKGRVIRFYASAKAKKIINSVGDEE